MKIFFTLLSVTIFISAVYAQPQVTLQPYATGLNGAISDIAHAGDARLFVAEQIGYIKIVQPNGTVSARPFLDIRHKVTPTDVDSVGEQGLLGLAFSPDYATSGNFYVHYTNKTGVGNVVVARYHVSSDADSADVMSEEILLNVYKPFTNHNGGCLKFGPDGFLYIGLGDGGAGGDPLNRAQNPDSLLGKILRIDVSGAGAYTIPTTNPFANGGNARPEIWALGVRNPWRFSFDRTTNHLWMADVGEQAWEEINFQNASSAGGENYGWRCYEGNHNFNTNGCGSAGSYVAPVYDYSHASTNGCSVTGGFVYRGAAYPALQGYYIYADYCNAVIYSLSADGNFSNAIAGIFNDKHFTTFGEDNTGELFVGDNVSGTVYRIAANPSGVVDDLKKYNIEVFPVPCHGNFNCSITLDKSAVVEVELRDITGKFILNKAGQYTVGKNIISVNAHPIAAGLYTLQLKVDNNVFNSKIIVQGE